MAPSLSHLGTAVLAVAGGAVAERFKLAETYDHTNFFDKFNWMTHPDLNNGHVKYQSLSKALEKGIAAIDGNEVYLGVDYKTNFTDDNNAGRPSFRIESKAVYGHGLIVGRFSHFPKPVCGSWPAFWTLGSGRRWPNAGEIDMYEGWNENFINKPAIHVGNSATFGSCKLDGANQTSSIHNARNCDNTFSNPPLQWPSEGCVSHEDNNGVWGSSNGGTQALEFTSDYIKIYTWPRGSEPVDLDSSHPDTSTWGTPSVNLKKEFCDIDKAFTEQKIILNVALCGNPVAEHYFWNEFKGQSGQTCRVTTGEETCADYVSKHPEDFKDVYWKVKDIRFFEMDKTTTTTSSMVRTSTTTKTTTLTSKNELPTTTSSVSTTKTTSKAATSSKATTRKISSSSTMTSRSTSSQKPASSMASVSDSIVDTSSSSVKAMSKPVKTSRHSTSTVPTASSGHAQGPSSSVITPAAVASAIPEVYAGVRFSNISTGTGHPVEMTTSTVYTTSVSTITSCPPHVDVAACAHGPYVTTVTIPLYTTICPVDALETAGPKPTPVPGVVPETVVAKVTKIYTITTCPPAVVRCPLGSATTEIGTTTYCPKVQCSLPTPTAQPDEDKTSSKIEASPICPGPSCHANKVFNGLNHGHKQPAKELSEGAKSLPNDVLDDDFSGKKVAPHAPAEDKANKSSDAKDELVSETSNIKSLGDVAPYDMDLEIDIFGDDSLSKPAKEGEKTPNTDATEKTPSKASNDESPVSFDDEESFGAKPSGDKPVAGKPSDDKFPAGLKPTHDKPAAEKPSEAKPAGNRPDVDELGRDGETDANIKSTEVKETLQGTNGSEQSRAGAAVRPQATNIVELGKPKPTTQASEKGCSGEVCGGADANSLETRGTNEMLGDLLTLPDDKLSPTGAQIKALLSGRDQPEGSLDVYLGVPDKDSPQCKADTCCIWKHIADDMSSKMKDSIAGCNSLARQCVRLGFHDAGSFSKSAGSTGGATGHTILARECYDRPINRGLPSACDQMTAWHEQYKQYGVSMADLIQFAANVATVTCPLGPRVRSFVGRKDNTAPGPENTLPLPTQNADELINLFNDKTISPDELVALVGAHTTATQHFFDQNRAGAPLDTTPGVWDVRFYGQVRQPNGPRNVFKFPSDIALAQDGRTRGTWDRFSNVVAGQLPWNFAYARAYIRLSMLGVNNINELQECTKALPTRLGSFFTPPNLNFELFSKNDPARENMTAAA